MIVRLLNLVVIGALILAASYVYQIKFDSTVQAEHLAKLRGQVRRERDAIATLRAEWGQLDNPDAHRAAGQAPSAAQADRADPIRHVRPPARAAAEFHPAG